MDILLLSLTSPLAAMRRCLEASRGTAGSSAAGSGAAVLLAGSLSSGLGTWALSGHGVGRPLATVLSLAGRLALDLACWLVAAALLGQAFSWLLRRQPRTGSGGPPSPRAGPGGPPPPPPGESPSGGTDARIGVSALFLPATACATAPRLYLLPLCALARLTGWSWLSSCGRWGVWGLVAFLLWLLLDDLRRHAGPRAPSAAAVLGLGLLLPVALLVLGLVASGLGWLLRPLFEHGFWPTWPL